MRRGDGAWGWLSRRASVEGAAREAPEDEGAGANGTSEALANRLDRNLVSLTSPDSEAADQYRLLFHRLRRAEMDQGECLRVVAVTSATDGEGKSLTAANLALIAAGERVSERVLLVDADLRRPSLHVFFGVPAAPGLFELARGEVTSAVAVRSLKGCGLCLLTAGALPGARDVSGAMTGAALERVIGALRQDFDAVYLDVPPLLSCADGAFLAGVSDGALIVVRAFQTSRQMVAQAVETLGKARLLGCVLNGVEARRQGGRG